MSSFFGLALTSTRFCLTCLLVLSTSFTGCGEATRSDPAPVDTWFEAQLMDQAIEIQIVYKNNEMSRGLMYRTSLGENQGMLFFYPSPRQMSFWMRNTKIPLDIGYFTADGVLREVYPMYPLDERSVKSQRKDIHLALEMNQGWFSKKGIRVGDTIDLEGLKAALIQRGVSERRIPF